MASAAYLDDLFGALQRLGEERKASERWMTCARTTTDATWRLTFLRAGRSSHEHARRLLDEAAAQLGPIRPARPGVAAEAMAPLERLAARLAAVRAELEAEEQRLGALEVELAGRPTGAA